MKKTETEQIKFKFTHEWQWDLLRYITLDKNGYKAITKVKDYYFTLIEHQVLGNCLIEYYKKNLKIPGETILRESLVSMLNSREYSKLITGVEQDNLLQLVPKLYVGSIRDADEIYKMVKQFSAYIRLKDLLEEIDPRDWESYQRYSHKFQNAIEDEDDQDERSNSFLLRSVSERQVRRKEHGPIVKTPFRQINALTNAGGYEKGSIIVVLDKQKKGKTTALVNIAKGYLRMGKKVLYLDFENGKDSILTRFEQSTNNLKKSEILDGEFDKRIKAKFRKYMRIGGEVVVERLPAGSNTHHVQLIIDKYYREYGIVFDNILFDYIGKMGSVSGTKDETARISDAYVEVANLALRNNIDHVWSAHHVTREGAKLRMKTRYEGEDIAKCIDIGRHVHAVFGLNRSPEEEEAGFLRFEVVEQRDGPMGRAVFTIDHETQVITELSKTERTAYDTEFAPSLSQSDKEPAERRKNKEQNNDDFKS
jgi:hypothetical protein